MSPQEPLLESYSEVHATSSPILIVLITILLTHIRALKGLRSGVISTVIIG